MKTYIVILIVVLAITCWLNDSGAPPYQYPTSFNGVKATRLGAKREAGLLPELAITNKSRSAGMITKIDGKSDSEAEDQLIDFPFNARN